MGNANEAINYGKESLKVFEKFLPSSNETIKAII